MHPTATNQTMYPVGTTTTTNTVHHGHHAQPNAAGFVEPNNRPGRGFIVGILSTIAVIFWLIAMTTPIAMVDYELAGQGRLSVDPWHACNKVEDGAVSLCRPMGHADEECAASRDTYRVEQAFLILTGLMLIPLLCCAALDFSHKLDAGTPDLPFGLHTHGWTIFFAFATALVSLIAFAVAFSIPRMNPCNNGSLYDAPNFEWGPSPVFSLLIFLISLIIIIVALVLREDGTVKTREEVMHPHSPIVHSHEHATTMPYGTRPAGTATGVTRPVAV